MLHEACFAIEAMGEQTVSDIKMHFSNSLTRPYREIFEPGKSDGEFSNAKRRFAWLKRTLKDFEEKFRSIFPPQWQMEQMLVREFCKFTKLHLDEILSV